MMLAAATLLIIIIAYGSQHTSTGNFWSDRFAIMPGNSCAHSGEARFRRSWREKLLVSDTVLPSLHAWLYSLKWRDGCNESIYLHATT